MTQHIEPLCAYPLFVTWVICCCWWSKEAWMIPEFQYGEPMIVSHTQAWFGTVGGKNYYYTSRTFEFSSTGNIVWYPCIICIHHLHWVHNLAYALCSLIHHYNRNRNEKIQLLRWLTHTKTVHHLQRRSVGRSVGRSVVHLLVLSLYPVSSALYACWHWYYFI